VPNKPPERLATSDLVRFCQPLNAVNEFLWKASANELVLAGSWTVHLN